jgi:hypothetical protein
MDKDAFVKLYDGLHLVKEINKELLLRVILEFVVDIDFNDVDDTRIKFQIETGGYRLDLFSKSNLKCPLYIEVLNYNEVDVQLNAGGEYLHLQPIKSWSDVSKLRSALRDVFFESIEETVIICGGEMKRASYRLSHKFERKVEQQSYSTVLGNCWFWQKKQTLEVIYQPWIQSQQ